MLKHEPLFKKSIHCHYKWRLLQPATEDIDPFMCLPVIDPPSNFLPNRLTIWGFCSLMAWLSALLAHTRGLHAETLSEIKWCVQGLIMHTHCSSFNILAQILFKHSHSHSPNQSIVSQSNTICKCNDLLQVQFSYAFLTSTNKSMADGQNNDQLLVLMVVLQKNKAFVPHLGPVHSCEISAHPWQNIHHRSNVAIYFLLLLKWCSDVAQWGRFEDGCCLLLYPCSLSDCMR